MNIAVPAIIMKAATTADRGLRLTVETSEIASVHKAELVDLVHKSGHFWFYPDDTTPPAAEDVQFLEAPVKKPKTPSQMLRAVIYRYWQMEFQGVQDFDEFYGREVNRLIESYREKLDV